MSRSARSLKGTLGHPLLRNFSFLAAGNVANRGLLFVANIHLARSLQPEAYGKIAVAQAILMVALAAADLGIRPIAIRDLARAAGPDRGRMAGEAWGVVLVVGGLAALLMVATAIAVRDSTGAGLVMLFALTVVAYAFNLDWVLKAAQRFGPVGLAEGLKGGCYVLGLVVFVRIPEDVLRVPLLYAGAWALGSVTVGAVVGWRKMATAPRIRAASAGRLMRLGVPLGITSILTHVYTNGGVMFLEVFAEPTDVGLFGAVLKLPLLFTFLAALFSETFYPSLAAHHARDPAAAWRLAKRALLGMSVVNGVVAIGLMIGARAVLALVFGGPYEAAAPELVVLTVAMLPLTCSTLLVYVLVAQNRQQHTVTAAALGVATVVGANLLLTPAFGIMGTCVATVATEAVVALTLFAHARSPTRSPGS